MATEAILNEIVNPEEYAVFKGMKTDMESGKALLNPEQLGKFLREAQINNTILNQADFQLMKSFKKQLTRVGINGRVLQSGYKADGKTTNPDLTPADVDFDYNELDAKKLKAMCSIEDEEKEDNIEKEQFENTLLSMMGERVGEDLEFWALFADKTATSNKLLSTTDGWIKKAGVQIKSKGADSAKGVFDLKNTIEAMFDSMIKNMPIRFRQKRPLLKFFVPFEVEDAYRNLLKSRGTGLGDETQTGFNGLAYKGIPIEYCPTLDAEDGRSLDNTATSILTNPKNMAWGIWKNLSIEPDRIPKEERTDYYYRIRGDVDYYFRNATVTAKISAAEAESIAEQSKG